MRSACTYREDNGIAVSEKDYWTYFYGGPDRGERPPVMINLGTSPDCLFSITWLLAAVDPQTEEALVGLSHALVKGVPLKKIPIPILPVASNPYLSTLVEVLGRPITEVASIPALVNVTPFVSFTLTVEAVPVKVPPDVRGLEDILQKGGSQYLDTLPRQDTVIAQATVTSEDVYPQLPQEIGGLAAGVTLEEMHQRLGQLLSRSLNLNENLSLPGECVHHYPASAPLPQANSLTLEAEITTPCKERQRQTRPFQYISVGAFDSGELGLSAEGLTIVPLELYFPPQITLLYDENGAPVAPKIIRPSSPQITTTLYFHPPPLLLTTLEAARAIAGDDCISAIRVRVAGVDRFSPEAQSKIEAVAAEIINRTGLDVDIVVGSSPRPVLVHLPGIGYVEEYWVQKGVALTTHREVQRANLLLFAAMLAVCALFIFNTTSTTVAGRIGEFGLLKALGWRGSSLAGLVLREGLLIGAVGGLAGTVLALGVAGVLGLVFPLGRALLILPTALLLCLAGFAFPAVRAAQVAPVVALRRGSRRWGGCLAGRGMWAVRCGCGGCGRC